MSIQHVALVPETQRVDASELARVSAALQKQVLRDLAPIWGIVATVDAFPRLDDVPIGYWPIILTDVDLGWHAGIHFDTQRQPYALVAAADGWSRAASRTCLEMLVNPFETRVMAVASPRSDQGQVELMVDVCSPCDGARFAYAIDGVLVSDFCTPAFFGAKTRVPERCSFTGAVTAPLQPQRGGHIVWYDPESGGHWLRSHWHDNPIDTSLGEIECRLHTVRDIVRACGPWRERPDAAQYRRRMVAGSEQALRASQAQAHRLRVLLGKHFDDEPVTASSAGPVSPALEPEYELAVDELFDAGTLVELDLDEDERTSRYAPSAQRVSTPPPLSKASAKQASEPPPAAPSIAPVTLAASSDRREERASRLRAPLTVAVALALAAAFGLMWAVRSVREQQALRDPHAAAPHAASAIALPELDGSPPNRMDTTSPQPPDGVAASGAPTPAACVPGAPELASTAHEPAPGAAIAPVPPSSPSARQRGGARTQKRRQALPLPSPPAPPAAAPLAVDTTNKPPLTSIEDLIESRR